MDATAGQEVLRQPRGVCYPDGEVPLGMVQFGSLGLMIASTPGMEEPPWSKGIYRRFPLFSGLLIRLRGDATNQKTMPIVHGASV